MLKNKKWSQLSIKIDRYSEQCSMLNKRWYGDKGKAMITLVLTKGSFKNFNWNNIQARFVISLLSIVFLYQWALTTNTP